MTLFSWYGPWVWPGGPALTVGRIIGGHASVYELPYAQRLAVIVLLIAVNSAFWAAAAWGIWWSVQRLTLRRREVGP